MATATEGGEAGPGFVLHSYPYKETSLIVEAFTRTRGRLSLVAKGAKRGGMKSISLQPFQPLHLRWFGRHELKTLRAVEHEKILPQLKGAALMSAFYLNELLMRLAARDDPHESLFDSYHATLESLSDGGPVEASLRYFELTLLEEFGYALTLDRDVHDGSPIEANVDYRYFTDRGPVRADSLSPQARTTGIPIAGRSLLALAGRHLADSAVLAEAKSLMRRVIQHHLGDKPLNTRQLARDLK